ncbi:hypothetical protein [Sphingomonas solaris]|uniref:Uncharacterized protein n=1 Tax=Alterirhizorhabdus solaris TaxID=2529389 RepID=A0A558R6J5_9SPHN|nr:hypothetical protein [Sphingomonas solaris]TVV75005.1 hypothetical protein FOY91_08500 [Sphingomonas solaris]
MATNPDPHPDSVPAGPAEAPDQITPIEEPGRESVEDPSPDSPGSPGGTGGTGGTSHENDTP